MPGPFARGLFRTVQGCIGSRLGVAHICEHFFRALFLHPRTVPRARTRARYQPDGTGRTGTRARSVAGCNRGSLVCRKREDGPGDGCRCPGCGRFALAGDEGAPGCSGSHRRGGGCRCSWGGLPASSPAPTPPPCPGATRPRSGFRRVRAPRSPGLFPAPRVPVTGAARDCSRGPVPRHRRIGLPRDPRLPPVAGRVCYLLPARHFSPILDRKVCTRSLRLAISLCPGLRFREPYVAGVTEGARYLPAFPDTPVVTSVT